MNVILITLDCVRPDFLGCYGNLDVRTPNIDRLASRGALFRQAITNGTYTKTAFPPILSSTYASMYSGPFFDIGEHRPMLAQILRSSGYATAGFTANPLLSASLSYNCGFEVFETPEPPPEDRKWIRLKGMQHLLSQPAFNSVLMRVGLDTSPHPVYVDGSLITEKGCSWIKEQTGNFFLWLHFMDAHWPYHDQEALQDAASRAFAWRDRQFMWAHRKIYPGKKIFNHLQQLYISAIERLDGFIGQLLECIESHGLGQDTLILLTSDHGEAFYEHSRWEHGAYVDFHEEILRIPLLIFAPLKIEPRVLDFQVCQLDVVPTVLDFLGINVDPVMEGQSLYQLFTASGNYESRPVITEMIDLNSFAFSIRSQKYKYIYNENREPSNQFFDLENDPSESIDLSGMRPHIEDEFRAILLDHLERIKKSTERMADGGWPIQDEVVARLKALGYLE